jgi:hypothetical protein
MLGVGDLEYLSYRTGLTEEKVILLSESTSNQAYILGFNLLVGLLVNDHTITSISGSLIRFINLS